MKLAPDAGAVEWLEGLAGGPEAFEWDAGNRSKQGKHGVRPADVEALVASPYVFAGRIVEPKHDEPRWILLGCDADGRRLALIFTRRGRRIRAISCRPMRRNEYKLFQEAMDEKSSA